MNHRLFLMLPTLAVLFAYQPAQAVETVCMNCHAASVSADVEAALNDKYPDDKARGYTLGQIRGAFSLSRDI